MLTSNSYGPAGKQIILATLQYHLYAPTTNAYETLTTTMMDILGAHGKDTNFWKGTKETTLSFLDFMCHVAVPHVANLLIAEDLKTTESEADKIRLASSDYGQHFHDTSEAIDDLVMRIAASAQVSFLAHPLSVLIAFVSKRLGFRPYLTISLKSLRIPLTHWQCQYCLLENLR